MAAGIIKFNRDSEPMRQVVRALNMIREGRAVLSAARAVLIQHCDGATGTAANWDLLAAAGTFQQGDYADANAAAMTAFAELDSLHAKLFKGAGDGDATGAAIDQACGKLGVV